MGWLAKVFSGGPRPAPPPQDPVKRLGHAVHIAVRQREWEGNHYFGDVEERALAAAMPHIDGPPSIMLDVLSDEIMRLQIHPIVSREEIARLFHAKRLAECE